MSNKRIGLLGGTFNPPHLGHLAMATAALQEQVVDRVWLLPCWKHAFGKEPIPFDHRAEMCRWMVRDFPDIFVCTAEQEIKADCSVKILRYIARQYPNKTFNLILGTDNYEKMDLWNDKEEVVSLAPPIWVARPGTKIDEETISCNYNVSSTAIRELLKTPQGQFTIAINRMMSSEVYGYILKHNLYGIKSA